MRFRQLGAGRKQRCAPLGQRIAFGAAGAQLRRSRRIRALGLARGVRRRRRLRLGADGLGRRRLLLLRGGLGGGLGGLLPVGRGSDDGAAVLHIVLQHGLAALALGAGLRERGELPLGLGRVARHFIRFVDEGVQPGFGAVKRLRRGVQLELGAGDGGLHPLALGLELIDAVQPERDLERSFFLVENQIALGVFGLLAQRLDADGDLGENVVDTEEVLLGIAQLAFGLQLFIADLADAGGLLEDAAALVPLLGKHLADLPLADNRIALAADAGIVKQLVNVL